MCVKLTCTHLLVFLEFLFCIETTLSGDVCLCHCNRNETFTQSTGEEASALYSPAAGSQGFLSVTVPQRDLVWPLLPQRDLVWPLLPQRHLELPVPLQDVQVENLHCQSAGWDQGSFRALLHPPLPEGESQVEAAASLTPLLVCNWFLLLQGYLVNWDVQRKVWDHLFGKEMFKVCFLVFISPRSFLFFSRKCL